MPSFKDAYKEANNLRISRLKAEEAGRKEAKKLRQIEDSYRKYSPPQIHGFPELCSARNAVSEKIK